MYIGLDIWIIYMEIARPINGIFSTQIPNIIMGAEFFRGYHNHNIETSQTRQINTLLSVNSYHCPR